jgi:hypothetical protein
LRRRPRPKLGCGAKERRKKDRQKERQKNGTHKKASAKYEYPFEAFDIRQFFSKILIRRFNGRC